MIVADTNLVGYLLIKGEFTQLARTALQKDKVWVAPPLWYHEFLNVVATNVREEKMSMADGQSAVAEAPIFVRSYDHERPWDVLRLSVESKIATYDCEFVTLARQMLIPLVTKDKALIRAFPDVAISLEDYVR